jgi:hypothetical protein
VEPIDVAPLLLSAPETKQSPILDPVCSLIKPTCPYRALPRTNRPHCGGSNDYDEHNSRALGYDKYRA